MQADQYHTHARTHHILARPRDIWTLQHQRKSSLRNRQSVGSRMATQSRNMQDIGLVNFRMTLGRQDNSRVFLEGRSVRLSNECRDCRSQLFCLLTGHIF